MGVNHSTTVDQVFLIFTLEIYFGKSNTANIMISITHCSFESLYCEIYGQKSIEVNWNINRGVLPPLGAITSPIFQTGDISN